MTRIVLIVIASVAVHAAIAAGMSFVDPPARRAPDRAVDVEVYRPPPPPPATNRLPAPPAPTPKPEVKPPPVEKPQSVSKETPRTNRAVAEAPPSTGPADPDAPVAPPSGGGPTLKIDNLGPGTDAVAPGRRTRGKHGQGGTGTGSGVGSGSATPAAVPMSIASIKDKAKPKGDYGYLDAGKDYPAEARRLGIEGQIQVRLVVDATGKVTKRTLLTKLGHGLDELALARAAKIEFHPALDTNDQPVASVVVWKFTFTLPE